MRLNDSHYLVSCGGYGSSRLELWSGLESKKLRSDVILKAEARFFFEGITTIGSDRLLVLTWREHVILELELPSFRVLRKIAYPYDGWGITYDDSSDIVWASDGSANLYKLDPRSLTVRGQCEVLLSHDGYMGVPVKYMNELEMVNGRILANVYMETARLSDSPNYIVSINPSDCSVDRILPVFGLGARYGPGNVFNGIAAGSNPGQLLVTGKMWKSLHAVRPGSAVSTYDPLWSRFNITDFLKLNLAFR